MVRENSGTSKFKDTTLIKEKGWIKIQQEKAYLAQAVPGKNKNGQGKSWHKQHKCGQNNLKS